MKANELMIGDWVNIYVFPNENPTAEDLFPARISTIMTPIMGESGGEHIECQFNTEGSGIGCASRPVETCLPIPLTADILVNNGFGYIEVGVYYTHFYLGEECYCADMEFHIGMDESGNISLWNRNNYIAGLHFVHELQHVIRILKIDMEIML